MNLASVFLAQVGPDKFGTFASLSRLNASLLRLLDESIAAWPDVLMDPDIFISFLAHTLPLSAAPHLHELKAGDLWLACAYGAGADAAIQIVETTIFPPIEKALARLNLPGPTIKDILQDLRHRLIEMQNPAQARQGYSGRGDLSAWLYVCAVRDANKHKIQSSKQQDLEDAGASLLPSQDEDPEMSYLQQTYKKELQDAFKEALASLTSRERNLLRYHFLEGMSIDRIGALYGVHRATAARWIQGARENLCERTRTNMCKRISLSEEGFERILGLIESQIAINLAATKT